MTKTFVVMMALICSMMTSAQAHAAQKTESITVNVNLVGFKAAPVSKLMDEIETLSSAIFEAGQKQGYACTAMHSDLDNIFQQDADVGLGLDTVCISSTGKALDEARMEKDLSTKLGLRVWITNAVAGGATISN